MCSGLANHERTLREPAALGLQDLLPKQPLPEASEIGPSRNEHTFDTLMPSDVTVTVLCSREERTCLEGRVL